MVLLEAEDGFGKPDGPAGATTSLNEFEAENCTSEACNDKDQVDEIHVNAMDWIPCGISLGGHSEPSRPNDTREDVRNIVKQLSSSFASLYPLGQSSWKLHVLAPDEREFLTLRGVPFARPVLRVSPSKELLNEWLRRMASSEPLNEWR
jgi:hypothetical protein